MRRKSFCGNKTKKKYLKMNEDLFLPAFIYLKINFLKIFASVPETRKVVPNIKKVKIGRFLIFI